MSPNKIAPARVSVPPKIAGGGFSILRPRWNVAFKLLREGANRSDNDQSSCRGDEQRKQEAPERLHQQSIQGC